MRTERSEGEQLEGEAEPEACRRMAEKQEQSLAGREPRGSMQRIGIGSRGMQNGGRGWLKNWGTPFFGVHCLAGALPLQTGVYTISCGISSQVLCRVVMMHEATMGRGDRSRNGNTLGVALERGRGETLFHGWDAEPMESDPAWAQLPPGLPTGQLVPVQRLVFPL